jgi:hypothetical protein
MSLSCRKYHLPSKRVNRSWLNFHGMLCVFMLGGIARQSYDAKECKSFYYPPTTSSYVATSTAMERRRYCPMVCIINVLSSTWLCERSLLCFTPICRDTCSKRLSGIRHVRPIMCQVSYARTVISFVCSTFFSFLTRRSYAPTAGISQQTLRMLVRQRWRPHFFAVSENLPLVRVYPAKMCPARSF